VLSGCKNDAEYRIEGKIAGLEDASLFVVFEAAESYFVDTVRCDEKGAFRISQLRDEEIPSITFYFNNRSKWFSVYPEAGKTVHVSGDADYPQLIQVKGGHTNGKLSEFKKKATVLLKELADEERKKQDPASAETDLHIVNIKHELRRLVANYAKENPTEEAAVILISDYIANPYQLDEMEEALGYLSPELNDNYIVKDLWLQINKAKTTIVGSKAPDYKVKDINGKIFTPDSFRNRYYILAFTASWCDMCQTEVLMLDRIVSKFSRDTLDALLVSLDDYVEDVRKMVNQDSISWNVVTDSAGQAINMFDLYNVSSLPNCFLIDGEGVIQLRTDNGLELSTVVDELIK
jgi:peroxiredoxin